MHVVLMVIVGAVSGVLGGLGMGGGTLLIPLLITFFEVEQKIAQSINLISFLPMSIVALVIHLKNKRVDFKNLLFMCLPALLFAVLGSLFAGEITSNALKVAFGVFLMILSVFNLVMTVKINKDKSSR